MALEQSWDKSEDDYVKELFEFFLNLRIDPKHPHLLRSISETEFQMLVKNAQGKIVSHGLAPQSAGAPVMINRVNPYPS